MIFILSFDANTDAQCEHILSYEQTERQASAAAAW